MKELEELGLIWAVKHRPELRTGGRVVTFDCGLIIPAAGMKTVEGR